MKFNLLLFDEFSKILRKKNQFNAMIFYFNQILSKLKPNRDGHSNRLTRTKSKSTSPALSAGKRVTARYNTSLSKIPSYSLFSLQNVA